MSRAGQGRHAHTHDDGCDAGQRVLHKTRYATRSDIPQNHRITGYCHGGTTVIVTADHLSLPKAEKPGHAMATLIWAPRPTESYRQTATVQCEYGKRTNTWMGVIPDTLCPPSRRMAPCNDGESHIKSLIILACDCWQERLNLYVIETNIQHLAVYLIFLKATRQTRARHAYNRDT